MTESIHVDTVVIGASAAGLATSACLKDRGLPHLLLEREAHVGHAWRNHYSRLHLHTPRSGSGLPGFPMPSSYPQYPARAQVVEYLERYQAALGLEPRFGEEVRRVARHGDGWRVETPALSVDCQQVVVATGYTSRAQVPAWPGQESFRGEALHSSAYRDGARFQGRRVLVVGFGNSGGEIAIDLVEHGAAAVGLAVRGEVNVVPRDLLGLPILTVGIAMRRLGARLADLLSAPLLRAAVGDLGALGLRKLPYGPFTQIIHHGRIPLIDVGTLELVREKKIVIHRGIERFTEDRVRFEGGAEARYDAVVLATGYTPSLDRFLAVDGLLDGRGAPAASGRELAPGLYCCGFHVALNGMLPEIGLEARRIAQQIAAAKRA